MKEFKNGIYKCYSPALREFLLLRGLIEEDECEREWTVDEQIKFREERNIPYDVSKVTLLKRKCWIYKGSDELSESLELWSKNRPKKIEVK